MRGGRRPLTLIVSRHRTHRPQHGEIILNSSEAAAWVQAIGSVLAIIAAFAVSSRQFRDATSLQREADRAERRRRYEALTGLVEAALEDFSDTLKALRGSEPNKWFDENSTKELMDEFYNAFIQTSPLDMPSAKSARSLVTLRDRLKTAAWNANAAIDHGTGSFEEYMACVEAMESNLNEVRAEHASLLAELAQA